MYILVADDNIVNQKIACRMLEKLGHKADAASNGIEVLTALRRRPYDAILMDCQMPEMDGLQTTAEIRKQFPAEQQPRIVAMTAESDKEYRERCLACGMDDYMTKPLRIEDLTRVLIPRTQDKITGTVAGHAPPAPAGEHPPAPVPPDVSALQKQNRVLERLYFHDVTNAAVAIRGLAEMLATAKGDQVPEISGMILSAATKLLEQIEGQRLLKEAEQKQLAPSPQPLDSLDLLEEILAGNQEAAKERTITLLLDPNSVSVRFSSDKTILSHAINIMLKNAVEASLNGTAVKVDCRREDQSVVFRVWNAAEMPLDIQCQVFKKYYSTKRAGLGLGTYSLKLLTEQYLDGNVWFNSGPDGTTFFIRLPLVPPVSTRK